MKFIEKIKKTYKDLKNFEYESMRERDFDIFFMVSFNFFTIFSILMVLIREELYKYSSEDCAVIYATIIFTMFFSNIILSLFTKLILLNQRKKNSKDEQDE